jgi:hypothetical protein
VARYSRTDQFLKDWADLDPADKTRFKTVVRERFVPDLDSGRGFRPGLRVKRVEGTAEVWEMTFAPDGRATWQYAPDSQPNYPHVVWRRIGTHDVFRSP